MDKTPITDPSSVSDMTTQHVSLKSTLVLTVKDVSAICNFLVLRYFPIGVLCVDCSLIPPVCLLRACVYIRVCVCVYVGDVCLCRFLPACLPAFQSVCLSSCLAAYLPSCLPVCLPFCLSACLSVCLPACLPACLIACLTC